MASRSPSPGRQARAQRTRDALIGAMIDLVRAQGYAATSVDQLCAHAGVTKGAFFHHFSSKDALAEATAEAWGAHGNAMFAMPGDGDAVETILAYIDARLAAIDGDVAGCSCLAGTMVQEVHASNTRLRDACGAAILGHAATLDAICARAIAEHGVTGMTGALGNTKRTGPTAEKSMACAMGTKSWPSAPRPCRTRMLATGWALGSPPMMSSMQVSVGEVEGRAIVFSL